MAASLKPLTAEEVKKIIGEIPPNNVNTRMKNIKNGILMVISNLAGCPAENYKGDDLTQIPCKNSYFNAIEEFLRRNINNNVVFMGDFFGKGPYVMNVIIRITELADEFKASNQVHIVVGTRDINLWRIK